MSKFVVALHREVPEAEEAERRIRRILEEITPDMARGEARYGFVGCGRHLQGTVNLPGAAPRSGMSFCQGKIYGPADRWAEPGAPFPDGSYALIRDNARFLEAVSDPTASRTLWTYFDDEIFVVSNSQRAVTLYAGRFEFQPAVVPWLLATGTLGPGLSYNRHLGALLPASSLLLDKAAWTLKRTEGEIRFAAADRPHEAHRAALEAALDATLASFGQEDVRGSILALSGGADSRAIGALLARRRPGMRWKSFTGGPAAARDVPGTDVQVAAQAAARIGTEHRFIPNQASSLPMGTVIARFLLASEGRIDHLGGYLDGLEHFRTLTADGIDTIIRGDTCFGGPIWEPAESELAMRRTISLLTCGEITNLRPHLATFGLAGHALPAAFARHEGESLLGWRDRLYLMFRAPCVLSALTETKSAFVDVVNPLLSRRAIETAGSLPDELRLDKALFRELVGDLVPHLPFAQEVGGISMANVLRQPEVRRLLTASLATATARDAFGERLVDWVRGEISMARQAGIRAVRAVARLAGRPEAAPAGGGPPGAPLRLAFRIHMARVMIDQLTTDAALFGGPALLAGERERRSA